jgi:hypothetical protein
MNRGKRKIAAALLSFGCAVMLVMAGWRAASAGTGPADTTTTRSVEFTNCVETIGVALVPTASARALVPAPFVLAGEGQSVTPLVVRTARCAIAVPGGPARTGEIVQIGSIVSPPDGGGNINIYTIFYYTSDTRLALELRQAGVNAEYVSTIDYDYNSSGNSLQVRLQPPGLPKIEVSGTVSPSSVPAGSFVANWWQAAKGSFVKMSTNVLAIMSGGANLALTTSQDSPLGRLTGGSSTGFPVLQQFNC